jgi:hypothetical protein
MRDEAMKPVLLSAVLFVMSSCHWNGVVELDIDTVNDSENGAGSSDNDDGDGSEPEVSTDSESTRDTDSVPTGSDPDDPDLVLVQVFLPQNAQSGSRVLCGYFTVDTASPDWESDAHFCNTDSDTPGTGDEPPQRSRWINMPRNELQGLRFVHVVLYMSEESQSGTTPVIGVDYTGRTPVPVELFAGMGIVRSSPIYLGPQ